MDPNDSYLQSLNNAELSHELISRGLTKITSMKAAQTELLRHLMKTESAKLKKGKAFVWHPLPPPPPFVPTVSTTAAPPLQTGHSSGEPSTSTSTGGGNGGGLRTVPAVTRVLGFNLVLSSPRTQPPPAPPPPPPALPHYHQQQQQQQQQQQHQQHQHQQQQQQAIQLSLLPPSSVSHHQSLSSVHPVLVNSPSPPLHFFSEVISVAHGDHLYFCGPIFFDSVPRTMVTALSLVTSEWRKVTTKGESPDPLMMFKKIPLFFVREGSLYVIFSNSSLAHFRMERLNLSTFEWSLVPNRGSSPPARDYQCGGIHGDSFYLFSVDKDSPHNGYALHRLDFASETWTALEAAGPCPTYPASGLCVHRGKMHIFSKHANKLHSLCLNSLTWTTAVIVHSVPSFSSKRHSHLMKIFEDKLYLLRACDQFQLYAFDFETKVWEKVETLGQRPHTVRTEATTVIFKNTLYALGGQGGLDPTNHLFCISLKPQPKRSDQQWLGDMMKDGFTDVIFVLDGNRRIHAHRSVLAARSAYFSAMFRGGFREGMSSEVHAGSDAEKEIAIPDISFAVFEALIKSYYHQLDLASSEADKLELFEVASRYLNIPLQQDLSSHLARNLTIETALEVYKVASDISTEISQTLKDLAGQFIWENFEDVTSTQTFLGLCSYHPELAQELCSGMGRYQSKPKRLKLA